MRENPMTTDHADRLDLDAIRRREQAATPGPWTAGNLNEDAEGQRPLWGVTNDAFRNPPADDDAPWIAVEVHVGDHADAEFIAHARRDIPALLAEVDRLRAEWYRLVNERAAMLGVIRPALAWAEAHEDSANYEATIRATADLYGAVEQYRQAAAEVNR
jgi:hypothetical protein